MAVKILNGIDVSGSLNLAASDIPSLDASKIGSGTINSSRMPDIDASKITTGTFAAARIPNIDASKITAGTFHSNRMPDLSGTYALAAHNHDDRYYTEAESNARYFYRGSLYNSNFTRAGYGYWNAVAQTYWWKVCTVVANGSYRDYNVHLDWTSRYASGELLLHVHTDADTIIDVFDDYVLTKTPEQGKPVSDFAWIKPDDSTLEIWVKTPAWQEFDYLVKSNANEGTPDVVYYSQGDVEPLTSQPAGSTTFNSHKWNIAYDWGDHSSQGYLTSVAWNDVTGKPTLDNYSSWNLKTNSVQRTTVGSGGDLNLVAGTNVSLSYSAGGTVTISSTDTNTDTNNYLTGLSFSTSNGVLTATRQGLADLTVDLDGRYALAGDENIIDGATAIWNPDGDGDVFSYSDSNPTHNGKYVGAVIDVRGDGTSLNSLWRTGTLTADHVQVSRGYYVGGILDSNSSDGVQVIDANGNWVGNAPTPAAHTHSEYLTSVPAEYLTQTEGDARYLQSLPSHNHDGVYFKINTANQSGYLGLNQNPVGTTYGDTISTVPSYYFGQKVGDNDGWRLYGEAPASNDVKMIFEIIDDIESGDTWVFRNKKTYSPFTATEPFKIQGNGNIIAAGTITASGYNKSNWDTAFGWGNHASAGYLTSVPNHSAALITSGTLTSARLSGTYNISVSGSSASSNRLNRDDNRTISPSEDSNGSMSFGFTSWTNNNTGGWADYLHLRSYTDSSGGNDNLVMFSKDSIEMRIWQQQYNSSTPYANFRDVAFKDELQTPAITSNGSTPSLNSGITAAEVRSLIGAQAAGTFNTVIGTDSDINTSGSTIIDNIYVTDGVITSMGTRTLTAADLGIAQPAPPAGASCAVVGDTIEVSFDPSPDTVDYYQVWASQDGGSYALISQVPKQDFAPLMTVVDTAFSVSGTRAYRVYAVRHGIYSDPATTSRAYTQAALEPVNMNVVPMEEAFFIQWDAPASRFVDHYEVWVDTNATQSSLSRSNATLAYSGNNTFYMHNASNNEFHQFWVEITES